MSGMSDVRGSGLSGSFDPSISSLDGGDESEEGRITDDERRQLESGLAECDISAFTPAQARDILKPPKRSFPFQTVPDRPPKGHPCVHCGKVEGEIILVTEPGTLHHHHPLHMACAAEFFSQRKNVSDREAMMAARSGKKIRAVRSKSDDLPYDGPVVTVPESPPDTLDEHGVSLAARLNQARIRELADWYKDETHRRYNENRLNTPELDADLRATLRKEVKPELVEAAFEQVMQLALAV